MLAALAILGAVAFPTIDELVGPAVLLPSAAHVAPFEGRPTVISIGLDQIYVEGRAVEGVEKLSKDGYWAAPGLERALKEIRDLGLRLQAANPGATYEKVVEEANATRRKNNPPPPLPSRIGESVVIADAATPYRLVKKVLFTANKVGYTRVQFAVRAKDGTVQRLALGTGSPARKMTDKRVLGVLGQKNPPLGKDLDEIFAADPKATPGLASDVFGKGKGDASIGIGGDETEIDGQIDPPIIDAVIKRHLAQIQYCYERELPKKPELAGKIIVNFTIQADGTTLNPRVKSSTMNHAGVEGCIVERFRKIRFPQPRGGGLVTVSYPFLFKSGSK